MNDIEKRARDFLADEYERRGSHCMADEIRVTALAEFGDDDFAAAIRAVIAALTPPDGFVLVPVEPTEAMCEAGNEAESECRFAEEIYADMLAARPEVP